MALISVEGAYDLHVHSAPCIFPRLMDDLGTCEAAERAGLHGVVLKSHHESTVRRAAAVNTILQQRGLTAFRAFGALALNHAVGGVNPAAVEAAIKDGARVIWMPTVDSLAHLRVFGHNGGWDVQGADISTQQQPLTILDGGDLNESARAVVRLCQTGDVALGTGHLGADEIMALARDAAEIGFDRLVVTHPNCRVPGLDNAALTELAALGVWFEFTYCTVSPMWRHATIDETVAAIRAVGVERTILSSDGGQLHNPPAHEGLRLMAQMCDEKGLTLDDVRRMIVDNPARLIFH